MRLPPVEQRHKVKKGQVWRRVKLGTDGTTVSLVITGTRNNDWVHTVKIDNRKCQHRMRKKDLWLFYELIESNGVKQSHNV